MKKFFSAIMLTLTLGMPPMHARELKNASAVATTGEQRVLVVRVQFTDKKFLVDNATWVDWLNKENATGSNFPGGSVRDYYISQSAGQYKPTFDLYDVTLATSFASYAADGLYATPMAKIAKSALNMLATKSSYNPANYDSNYDGVVDNVTFILPLDAVKDNYTPSQSSFSAATDVASPTIKNYKFDTFNMVTEHDDGSILGIGTFIHEFGHVMGFPDCYYSTSSAYRSNRWDIMNEGIYNAAKSTDIWGSTPPNINAYQAWALGWHTPTEITAEGTYSMNIWNRVLNGEQKFESFFIANPDNENDVYVFEYRSNRSYTSAGKTTPYSRYDAPLPGAGMLIWHVVYQKGAFRNNQQGEHIKLMCADNDAYNTNAAADPWPGKGNVTTFTSTGSPAFRWNLNEKGKVVSLNGKEIKLTNIKEENNVLSFTVESTDAAVENILGDDMGTAQWYTIDGRQLTSRPTTSGIYIRRAGNKTEKVMIR